MRNFFIDAPLSTGRFHFIHDSLDPDEVWGFLSSKFPALLSDCRLVCKSSTQTSGDFHLRFALCLPGGKGGFGSQLRAAGGRNNGNKKVNTEAMKDTSGRRLRTLKKAQAMAEALRDAPEREREARNEKRDKLLAIINTELPGRGGRQVKFEDEDYITQSEEILKDIRAAIGETDPDSNDSEDDAQASAIGSTLKQALERNDKAKLTSEPKNLGIWDEEDSGSDEDSDVDLAMADCSGKGKARAIEVERPRQVKKQRT